MSPFFIALRNSPASIPAVVVVPSAIFPVVTPGPASGGGVEHGHSVSALLESLTAGADAGLGVLGVGGFCAAGEKQAQEEGAHGASVFASAGVAQLNGLAGGAR
jgi:hypothetical protein